MDGSLPQLPLDLTDVEGEVAAQIRRTLEQAEDSGDGRIPVMDGNYIHAAIRIVSGCMSRIRITPDMVGEDIWFSGEVIRTRLHERPRCSTAKSTPVDEGSAFATATPEVPAPGNIAAGAGISRADTKNQARDRLSRAVLPMTGPERLVHNILRDAVVSGMTIQEISVQALRLGRYRNKNTARASMNRPIRSLLDRGIIGQSVRRGVPVYSLVTPTERQEG